MSEETRSRFAAQVRHPRPDLAELALLVCAEVEPELSVDGELLRIDAFADQLRTDGIDRRTSASDLALALHEHLGVRLGFSGDTDDYHRPDNGLLTRVLDRRRGLPITLSILWIAVAERLGAAAYGIGLPGHFVAGIGAPHEPVVVDPFHAGRVLTIGEVGDLVARVTAGQVAFDPRMLEPTSGPAILRRLLNNLTRDFLAQGDAEDALWTVELKQLLPGWQPDDDHRQRGELLLKLGRYRAAAEAFETYVDLAEGAADAEDVATMARRARAKLN